MIVFKICLFISQYLVPYSQDKGIDYVVSYKSKVVFISFLSPQHTAFLYNINLFRYKITIKFDKESLVGDQNNYAAKMVNAYIVYEFDTCL